MGKRIISLFLICAVLIFGGCSSKKNSSASVSKSSAADFSLEGSAEKNTANIGAKSASSGQSTSVQTEDAARKVILNANVYLQVKELKTAYNSVIDRAKSMGGYVSSSTLDEANGQVTVRVPSKKMDEFLSFLETVGDVKDSSTSADDITEQYTDSESRLKSYKAQEEQLLAIMKKAETVEDILKVQSQLTQIRGEIEALQGKINMWDKLVELSTISIRITKAPEISGKNVKLSFLSWSELAKGMSNGFKRTLNFVVRFFGGLFIFLVSALPVIPFILVAVWLIIRYMRKKKKNVDNK